MINMVYKIAILASHPVQYQVPIFRNLSKHPKIDLIVYFCSNFGVRKADFDPGFGKKIKWDVDLLSGYKYKFLKNYSLSALSVGTLGPSFFNLINMGIIKELLKEKYDAILIHGYTTLTNWFSFLFAWITKTPIIIRGETDFLKEGSFFNYFIKKLLLSPLFKKIDAFMYSYIKNKEFFMNYGVSEKKLFFLPCAVDNSFFEKKVNRNSLKIKNKLKISENSLILLFVAKLIPRKRPMDLIKAFEYLNKKENIVLMFVGDGPEREKIERYVKDKNLKNIHFVGFKNQSKLPKYYSIADVFVLCSEHDPSPKAMNEAMASKLPIIATDKVGTAYDLVKNGKNGYIYPVGNIKKLAKCLDKILEDKKTIKKMGKKSFEIVSKWTFEEDVKGILKALGSIYEK